MKIEALIEALNGLAKNAPGIEMFGTLNGMTKKEIVTCKIADGIELKSENTAPENYDYIT